MSDTTVIAIMTSLNCIINFELGQTFVFLPVTAAICAVYLYETESNIMHRKKIQEIANNSDSDKVQLLAFKFMHHIELSLIIRQMSFLCKSLFYSQTG